MRRDAQMHSAVLSKSNIKGEGEALSLHLLSPPGHRRTPCEPLCLPWPLGTQQGPRTEQGSTSSMGLQGPFEDFAPRAEPPPAPSHIDLAGEPSGIRAKMS